MTNDAKLIVEDGDAPDLTLYQKRLIYAMGVSIRIPSAYVISVGMFCCKSKILILSLSSEILVMNLTNVVHHDNFISEFDTNLDCKQIIEYFNFINGNGLTVKRQFPATGAADKQLFIHELPTEYFHDSLSREVYQTWNMVTDIALNQYANRYDILLNRKYQHTLCKLQKTSPGEGYHQWHFESTSNAPYRSW